MYVPKVTIYALVLVAMVLLAGCTDRSARMTLEANHQQASTQVANLRVTATVQAARARTTVDFFETRAAAAIAQSSILEATLIAAGNSEDVIATFRAEAFVVQPTETPLSGLASINIEPQDSITSTAPPQSLHSPTPTPPIVTPFSARITPTAAFAAVPTGSDEPHLENPVTAAGVRSDDCASTVTTRFSSGTSEIYIVAEAVNVSAGSIIEARWFREGQPIGPIYSFAPESDIERACIWFFVDPSDFEFIPAQYSVDLLLNGIVASPRLPFTITTR